MSIHRKYDRLANHGAFLQAAREQHYLSVHLFESAEDCYNKALRAARAIYRDESCISEDEKNSAAATIVNNRSRLKTLNDGGFMHLGYAIELALKSAMLKMFPSLSESFYRSIPTKGSHNLTRMAQFMCVPVSTHEIQCLDCLSHCIKWSTRYPMAATAQEESDFKRNVLYLSTNGNCHGDRIRPFGDAIFEKLVLFADSIRRQSAHNLYGETSLISTVATTYSTIAFYYRRKTPDEEFLPLKQMVIDEHSPDHFVNLLDAKECFGFNKKPLETAIQDIHRRLVEGS